MKTILALSFLVSVIAAAPVACSSGSLSAPRGSAQGSKFAPEDVDLTFTLYTESLDPLGGGVVLAKSSGGGGGVARTTDSLGHTAPMNSRIGRSLDVSLRRRRGPYGVALGQTIRSWVVPAPPFSTSGSDLRLWEAIFTQPVLRPVVLDSSVGLFSDPNDALWILSNDTGKGSGFSFPASVGSLSHSNSVYAYFDYAGIVAPETDYRYGLGFFVQEKESFGTTGITVSIDTATLSFQVEPSVDVYFVAAAMGDLGGSSLSVTGTDYTDGILSLFLDGELGAGTTVLLLHPSAGSPAWNNYEGLASPPSFPKASLQPVGSPPALDASSECTPAYTPPTETKDLCTPLAPVPNPVCPQAPMWLSDDPKNDVHRVGDKVCGNAGFPAVQVVEVTDWGANLSVKFDIKGVEIQPGGHYTRTDTTNTTIAPGVGKGCGECVQLYRRRTLVKSLWRMEWPVDRGFTIPRVSCEDRLAHTGCIDSAVVLATCPLDCD